MLSFLNNLSKERIKKLLYNSFGICLYSIVGVNIVGFVVEYFKASKVDSIEFSNGYFLINNEPTGINVFANIIAVIILSMTIFYFKAKKYAKGGNT